MKQFLCILALSVALLSACKKSNNLEDCIDQRIVTFNMEAMCQNGSIVTRHHFQGETVYVLREGNCGADFQDEVIDVYCATLGYLGGIAGNSQINGEDFNNAHLVDTLWVQ